MQTLVPIVARGRTEPPRLIGRDEFRARVERLRGRLAAGGLAALVACGDRRDYAPVCFLSGVIPREGWSAVVLPAGGPPELYAGVPSERDLPGVAALTWIGDVRMLRELTGRVAELSADRPVALAAPAELASSAVRGLEDAGARVAVPDLFAGPPSAAEVAVLREAAALAARAVRAVVAAAAAGAGMREAILEGELAARRAGAHDVRTLASESGALRPPPHPEQRVPEFGLYLALELEGYWGERLQTIGAGYVQLDAARRALDAGDGVRTVRLGLGCEPVDGPVGDGVYSLRLLTDGVLLSRTVRVDGGNVEALA